MTRVAELSENWLEDEIEASVPKCRFGCDDAIGIYHIPKGCHCWPDPVQALCIQHFIKAESTGPITLMMALTQDAPFSK